MLVPLLEGEEPLGVGEPAVALAGADQHKRLPHLRLGHFGRSGEIRGRWEVWAVVP
jgi:hypothetical protein